MLLRCLILFLFYSVADLISPCQDYRRKTKKSGKQHSGPWKTHLLLHHLHLPHHGDGVDSDHAHRVAQVPVAVFYRHVLHHHRVRYVAGRLHTGSHATAVVRRVVLVHVDAVVVEGGGIRRVTADGGHGTGATMAVDATAGHTRAQRQSKDKP